MQTKLTAKYLLRVFAILVALYLISFDCIFEFFGPPVRNELGWLGPTKRFDPQTDDIGKVGCYTGNDYKAYHFYRPLCIAWLWIFC